VLDGPCALGVSDVEGVFDHKLTPTISTPGAARSLQAAAMPGQYNEGEIGPGRLLREMVCKQTDGLVLQDLLGDDGRPGTFGDC